MLTAECSCSYRNTKNIRYPIMLPTIEQFTRILFLSNPGTRIDDFIRNHDSLLRISLLILRGGVIALKSVQHPVPQ